MLKAKCMADAWSWRHAILGSELSSTTRYVLLVISCHMNDLGDGCYPSTRTLSDKTGLSERCVCEHIKIAAKNGWLDIQAHGFAGQQWARNEYRAAWPKGAYPNAKALTLTTEGADPNDKKALTEGQSNISTEHSRENDNGNQLKATRRANATTTYEQHFGECEICPTELANIASTKYGLGQDRIEREWDSFCNYHRAKGSRMSNWTAAWRTWCGNALRFEAKNVGRGVGAGGPAGGGLAAALRASVANRCGAGAGGDGLGGVWRDNLDERCATIRMRIVSRGGRMIAAARQEGKPFNLSERRSG